MHIIYFQIIDNNFDDKTKNNILNYELWKLFKLGQCKENKMFVVQALSIGKWKNNIKKKHW